MMCTIEGMPEYFISFIEAKLLRIECMTGIHVLFWSMRGSLDIGIYRDNSDADIIFLFSSKDKKVRALHDIVGHGLDLWGWIIDDAVKTVSFCTKGEASEIIRLECAISDEHRRGSLSYYFGLFVAFGNRFCYSRNGYLEIYSDIWMKLYNPAIVLCELQGRIANAYNKICDDRDLSGSECLYGLWYALMERNIMDNELPGKNKIADLIIKYGDSCLNDEFQAVHNGYKKSNTKHGQIFKSILIKQMIAEAYVLTDNFLKSADLLISDLEEIGKKLVNF